MKQGKVFKALLLTLLALFLAGCAETNISCPQVTPTDLGDAGYVKKVNSFLVILDASSSMFMAPKKGVNNDPNDLCNSYPTKFVLAKDLVKLMNQTIPSSLDFIGGMRTFGPKSTADSLVYGMGAYNQADLAAAVDAQAGTGGTSPLSEALIAAGDDLSSSPGELAVIVFSDGEQMGAETVNAATALRYRYGDRLCIYTVHVGEDPAGKDLLDQVASAGSCGFATTADAINSGRGMADFVTKVFLDMDPDSDRDGVRDSMDKCPNTPYGLKVDSNGCPIPAKVAAKVTLQVNFDFDKSDIKPMYHNHLKGVADFMARHPATHIHLKGYTCSIGTDEYNMGLSQRRANSVRSYLVKKFGVASSRIMATGYGEADPVASNATQRGREQNRRVTAVISTMVEK